MVVRRVSHVHLCTNGVDILMIFVGVLVKACMTEALFAAAGWTVEDNGKN